jgi:hypothetical protein
MLGLERRIVLEDHLGERHALHLLEVIEERYFVLLPPAEAEALQEVQEALEADLDAALAILTAGVTVLGAHDHRFLSAEAVPQVLARSSHHILVLCGLGLADLPATVAEEELSPLAFADECRKRKTW